MPNTHVNEQFTVKVKNRPTVSDNENYWQVFEGDKHIDDFMQLRNDFSKLTPRSSHEKDCFDEKQVRITELFSVTDINQFEHLFKVELLDNLDQKDLEFLQ